MRRLALIVLAAPIVSVAVASAASLTISSGDISAGNASVAACDGDGFTSTATTSGGKVTSVTVGGIADPGCEGGELKLSLTTSGTQVGSGGPVTVPTDADTADNQVTVSIGEQPAPDGIDATRIVIAGP